MVVMKNRLMLAMVFFRLRAGGAFASRHLILQGCSPQSPNPSSCWLQMKNALVDGLLQVGIPFHSISCPLNKFEERAAVESVLARYGANATSSGPLLIVSALVQPGHCYLVGANAAACPPEGNNFSTYMASLTGSTPTMHLWIEVAPDMTQYGLNASVDGSLLFAPNNFDGGRMAGIQYCLRTEGSRPQRIAALLGDASAQHSFDRIAGFESALQDNCPRHVIVSRAHADWSTTKAKQVASKLFLADGSITTVVCANDGMALGVIDAAKEALPNGLMGLLVVGYDNTQDIHRYLAAGTVPVTVDQLSGLPDNGLMFTLRGALRQMDRWSQDFPGALSTEAVMDLFHLDVPVLQSRVMPVVTNMKGYVMRALMNNYDKQMRPFSHFVQDDSACGKISAPTPVEAQFYLHKLGDINEIDGTFSMEGYLRLWWNDTRLKYDGLAPGLCIHSLPLLPNKLWFPDIYFDGATNMGSIFAAGNPQPAASHMEVYPSGEVFWSRHTRLILRCDMDFTWLPYDTQTCLFSIGTYSQDSTQVHLSWRAGAEPMPAWQNASGEPWTLLEVSPIESTDGIQLGTWSFAHTHITLQRNPRSRQNDMLLAGICVFLIYVSFWVRWDTCGLHIVVLLILVTQREMVQGQLPPGANAKNWLLDFLNGCLFFVVVAVCVEGSIIVAQNQLDDHKHSMHVLGTKGMAVRAALCERLVLLPEMMRMFFLSAFVAFGLFMRIRLPGPDGGVVAAWVAFIASLAFALLSALVAVRFTCRDIVEAMRGARLKPNAESDVASSGFDVFV